ncbi:MAG: type VI secretion system tube protein Hcp [Opitutaceae bacterium]
MNSSRNIVCRLVTALLLASFFSLSASGAGYIKFDGVDGESNVSGREGQSEVVAWSWSVVRANSDDSGSTRTRGSAVVGDLMVTKLLDKASVKLIEACLQGKVYPTVTLTLDQPGAAGGLFTYLVIEMKGVLVSSFSVGQSEGEDRPTESVSMNFEEIKVTYSIQNSDGSSGGNVETTWKIEEGTP